MMDLGAGTQSRNAIEKLFGFPILTGGFVNHGACRRLDASDWNFLVQGTKAAKKFLQRNLLPNQLVANLREQNIPIGVAAVELSQLIANVNVCCVRDKSRIP